MSDKSPEMMEIVGVVEPPGAGGAKNGKEALWSLVFSVHPWKREGGTLDTRKLRLVQEGFTDEQLKQGMGSIKPYSIIRARVRLFEVRPNMLLSAQVLEVRDHNDPDAEFRALALQQQTPVVLSHPVFGELTLNRGHDSFQATVMLAGKSIEVHIDANNETPNPAILEIAERFWKDQATWDRRLREFAAAQLIELKNEDWLQDDEKPLSEAKFIKKLTPNSMGFEPPDQFTIYYNDGDIFWGHAIEIRGTLSKGPQSADIAG